MNPVSAPGGSGDAPGAPFVPAIPFAVLAALATLSTAAMDMVVPLLATLERALPGAGGHPGLVLSIFPAGSAIAQLLCGPVSDRVGRRRLLLAACGLYAVASAGCAVAGSFATLATCRLAVGAGAGVCLSLTFAVIRDTSTAERTATTVAKVTAAMWASSIVAVPIAGWLLVGPGWRTVFVLLAAASLALLAALARRLPETLATSLRKSLSLRRVAGDYGTVIGCAGFRAHALMGAMAFATLFVIGVGATSLLPVPGPVFGLLYGIVIAGLSAGSVVGNALLTRAVTPVRLQGVAAGLMLAASGALLALSLRQSGGRPPLAAATLLLTLAALAIGLLTPCSIAAGVALFGQRAGTAAAALGIARMLGAASVSAAVAWLGADDPVVVSAVMALCAAIALTAWSRVRTPAAERGPIGGRRGPAGRRATEHGKPATRLRIVHGSLDHDPLA